MAVQEPYAIMADWTEQMYRSLEKMKSAKMIDQLILYHREAARKLDGLSAELSKYNGGELLNKQKREFRIMCDDFQQLENMVGSKYKIYLRGCGKAGKSTLLNALLSLDEKKGSLMGLTPMTFTIDTYTDTISADEAEIRRLMPDGRSETVRMSHNAALEAKKQEDEAFRESKRKCDKMIEEKTRNVHLDTEREDIAMDIYQNYLIKTSIREVFWGIGENPFFHNCVLIDTPGLSQDLRFTNVIEDVKEYEIDGIIWVISSDTLSKDEVVAAYQKEMEVFSRIYSGGNVIGVINMYGNGPDYQKGSKLWERVKKRAEKIYCGKYDFDEVICVNAQLAYEGGLAVDREKLENSNIAELRTKLNQLFAEKMSDNIHQQKKDKVESILDNMYHDVDTFREALDKRLQEYDQRTTKIEQLGQSCRQSLRNQLSDMLSHHMATVSNNIASNLPRLQAMVSGQQQTDSAFLKDHIVRADELEHRTEQIVRQNQNDIFQKFQANRALCVISNFRTEKYALNHFEKNAGHFSVQQSHTQIHMDIQLKNLNFWGLLDSAFNEVKSGYGGLFSRVGRAVGNFVTQITTPVQVRIQERIKNELSSWINRISLDGEISRYESQFRDALTTSMNMACGRYDDIRKIVDYEKDFLKGREKMEWQAVGLQQLIG